LTEATLDNLVFITNLTFYCKINFNFIDLFLKNSSHVILQIM